MLTKPVFGGDSRHSELPPLLREAVTAHETGKLHVAYPLYRSFVDQNPEHPMALHLLGLLHSQRREYDKAIPLMQASLRLFPEQAEVANNLGNALSRHGRVEEAIGNYSRAIQLQPQYAEAWRNQGLAYLRLDRSDDASTCFQRCLEINPDDAEAWLSMGALHQRQDDLDAAISCYEKALAVQPDYAEAHHNIGVCLRLQQRSSEALEHYKTARSLGLDRAELYHNLGNALVDTLDPNGAIDAYRAALEQNPTDLYSHLNLNGLLWQQDLLEDYLKSYKDALDKHPAAVELRVAYATALMQQEEFEAAERLLTRGVRHSPESSELQSLLAYSQEGQGRWKDALKVHAAAVKMSGSIPNHHISYARALLACQRPDEALQQAQLGAVQMPFNQRALAYLGLCWRMLGDERDQILNDYEGLVSVYDVPISTQFANAEEFNDRLTDVLGPLHIGKRPPAEQTLRGGSQTNGNLFDRAEPEIDDLVEGFRQCIREYIDQFPQDIEHPLFSRRSEKFDFTASWSVRLARCGYHTMHTHPLGWISSAYYVQVPPEIVDSDAQGGGLKFGEPDIDLGDKGTARRTIQPSIGRLVLFPSYMWHGTVPFESDEPRMTVAFDVVPEK